MRRLSLLGGFALLLSGSSNANPVLATKSPAIPEIPAAKSVALRNVETPGAESETLKKPAAPALPIAVRSVSTGEASWYGPGFYGNRTANGELFRPGTLTAAHRTLPFGTKVRVTNLWNGRSAIVRINDRGPFHGRRVIDLAHGAASQLGLISSGIAQVKLEVLQAQ
ncbi:MAG: septal ring lytic transglycosylase RlpA family protein [Vulcanococcus sp.]|jgi:rare lipoprotein A|uniref:septal ring lytic transglycosylase RlpA family protein n=1 Tax=unclassified Vulcanococcus TaxID=2766969 RepID=UPI0025D40F9C|nr:MULTISPECIES: septal ring lytic transglycosylase RlpA family protein [unclassified Vulcanococcus]MDA0726921.1 septal ring lytic transglycosylase RlpA family protein [Cyanobacteriota bacterium]MDA1157407.1 septal ring lytic transglycosylase RlpA family protein [Cyanobacteriota bacterium]NCV92214.1 septal ring lytic transglycosylase RlpA family protein [Synechococcaceae bacterium WB7_3xG_012]